MSEDVDFSLSFEVQTGHDGAYYGVGNAASVSDSCTRRVGLLSFF